MKRDMELVRKILFNLEDDEETFRWKPIIIDGFEVNTIAHHLKIMDEANLIEAKQTVSTKDRHIWMAKDLTWNGHEFLDSIRNDKVWNKTKKAIKSKGFELGNVPIDILKECAKLQLKDLFGLD